MLQKDVAFGEENIPESGVEVRGERALCVFAHLSVFVNLLTGFLGPVAALILRLTCGRQSPQVGRHAMRSFWNQVAWLLLVAPVGFLFTISLLLLLPVPESSLLAMLVIVAAAWLVVPFAEGAWAAYRASRGEDYRYLLDRLTSQGNGDARRGKKRSHVELFDDPDEDDDFGASGDYFASDGDSSFGDDSGGSDFGGGDSGSW